MVIAIVLCLQGVDKATHHAEKRGHPGEGQASSPTRVGLSLLLPLPDDVCEIANELHLALFVVTRWATAAAAATVVGPHWLGKVSKAH